MFHCGEDFTSYEQYAALLWRHNDHDGVSNHQSHGCLLNRLFRRRSKKTSKLRVTGICAGNSPGPVNSPHKGPVTQKMVPFDDVIMKICLSCHQLGPMLVTCSYGNIQKWRKMKSSPTADTEPEAKNKTKKRHDTNWANTCNSWGVL